MSEYSLAEVKLILRNHELRSEIERLNRVIEDSQMLYGCAINVLKNQDSEINNLKAEIENRADHQSFLSRSWANDTFEKDAEIERLQAKQRWVTTSPKKMPKDKVWVLVLINEQIFRAQRYGGKWMLDTKKFVPIYPSKWMPLPEVS